MSRNLVKWIDDDDDLKWDSWIFVTKLFNCWLKINTFMLGWNVFHERLRVTFR